MQSTQRDRRTLSADMLTKFVRTLSVLWRKQQYDMVRVVLESGGDQQWRQMAANSLRLLIDPKEYDLFDFHLGGLYE